MRYAILTLGLLASAVTAAPVPKAKADGGLIWVYDQPAGELVAYTPAGDQVRTVKLHGEGVYKFAFHGITPDGRFALFAGEGGQFPAAEWFNERTRQGCLTLYRLPLFGDGKAEDTGIVTGFGNRFAFLPDSGILHSHNVTTLKDPQPSPTHQYAATRYDADGKNPERLDLPASMQPLAALPGGEFLIASERQRKSPFERLYRFKTGEKPELVSGELNLENVTTSPDGKSVIATRVHSELTKPDGERFELVAVDLASGKDRRVDTPAGTGYVRGFWAPDGERLAVQWHTREERKPSDPLDPAWRAGAGEIAVCDADGGHRRVVLKLDDPGEGAAATARRQLLGWFPDARPAKEPLPKK